MSKMYRESGCLGLTIPASRQLIISEYPQSTLRGHPYSTITVPRLLTSICPRSLTKRESRVRLPKIFFSKFSRA